MNAETVAVFALTVVASILATVSVMAFGVLHTFAALGVLTVSFATSLLTNSTYRSWKVRRHGEPDVFRRMSEHGMATVLTIDQHHTVFVYKDLEQEHAERMLFALQATIDEVEQSLEG